VNKDLYISKAFDRVNHFALLTIWWNSSHSGSVIALVRELVVELLLLC